MPLYPWQDEITAIQVDIMRSFSEYKDPPAEDDEEVKRKMTPEQFKAAKWRKQIGKNIKITKGDNWGGGKGSWGK